MSVDQVEPPPSEDSEHIAPVSETPSLADAGVALAPETLAELIGYARAAISNAETSEATDEAGRAWFICPDVADNRSTVLIRARKGGSSAERSLSTALLGVSTQPAEDAITAICAELS